MLDDFFACVTGRTDWSQHESLLGSHLLGGSMLSAIFESVATGGIVNRRLEAPATAVVGAA